MFIECFCVPKRYHPPSNHKERLKTMISGKGAEERIGNLEICIGSGMEPNIPQKGGSFK